MSARGARLAALAIILGGLMMASSLGALAWRIWHIEQGMDPEVGPRAHLLRQQDELDAMLRALLVDRGIPTPNDNREEVTP